MTDYLNVCLSDEALGGISSLGLAHIGDCVYELLVRSLLVCGGTRTNSRLHRATVAYVCAPAQARALKQLLPVLTEDERAVCRRGRNARVHSIPRHAESADYHAATALECLFGWLYLKARHDRINELFARIVAAEAPEGPGGNREC